MDLDRMRLLRELRLRGTMTEVAAALSYSRSAVSQQLSLLEREAGTALFEPDGRRVRITPAGLLVADAADRMLAELEQLKARLQEAPPDRLRTIRIASMQSVTLALIPPMLDALRTSRPGLRLQVEQAEPDAALSGLLSDRFDLVVIESYPQWPVLHPPGVRTEVALVEPMRLAEADRGDEAAPVADLADYRDAEWAMEPDGTPARSWADSACRAHGFSPLVGLETADLVSQARFAADGHVVALLPELIRGFIDPGIRLRDLGPEWHRELHLATRSGSEEDQALRAVAEAFAAAATATTSSS